MSDILFFPFLLLSLSLSFSTSSLPLPPSVCLSPSLSVSLSLFLTLPLSSSLIFCYPLLTPLHLQLTYKLLSFPLLIFYKFTLLPQYRYNKMFWGIENDYVRLYKCLFYCFTDSKRSVTNRPLFFLLCLLPNYVILLDTRLLTTSTTLHTLP